MDEVLIRIEGRAGRITLNRPAALNALTPGMALAMDAALIGWAHDPAVALVLIDGAGPRAFCAGGDIAKVYAEGITGEAGMARDFWRDEYRMNLRLAEYPKPVVSLMHGFIMGGGVGVGCHGHPRVVGETAQVAMPECGIGLIPDVGGTYLLARAPGHLGDYLGLTGTRMGPGDAILAGFADLFVPEADWPALVATLCTTDDVGAVTAAAQTAPDSKLAALLPEIERLFAIETVESIRAALESTGSAFAAETLKVIARNSPLSMACTLAMIRSQRAAPDLRRALEAEYRFTYRAVHQTDFLEGVRAAVIDKDRKPRWRLTAPSPDTVAALLAPLGPDTLTFPET
ncbi:MAG: enoyl-CoA hydratase/isomerase family protein [Rhodobacteraceae bacterium]|nr:enoyl-CoA hydratase/isomerase family protein [Paracoccaceae bacterium]